MRRISMKKTMKKIIIGILLIYILGISTVSFAAAETTVKYTIEPEMPDPLSRVTVTAEIDGDQDIISVRLEMQECTVDGICYGWDTNISMDKIGDTSYEADIDLEYDDAAYFSLRLAIERNDMWEVTEGYEVDLNLKDPGNGDTTDSTPGFEMALFLISLIAVAIILRRKRS
jgi:hypothetical protein